MIGTKVYDAPVSNGGLGMENVVAELAFGERSWIAAKMIAKEADSSVIGVTGARSFGIWRARRVASSAIEGYLCV